MELEFTPIVVITVICPANWHPVIGKGGGDKKIAKIWIIIKKNVDKYCKFEAFDR